jgi:cytochrome c biogenesis protein CcdA
MTLAGTFSGQIVGAFAAGLLASLSPCVYPLIPLTIGFLGTQSQSGNRGRLLAFATGQTLTFVLLGIIAVKAGETFGFASESREVNLLVGVILIISGVFSGMGRLPSFTGKWNHLSGKVSSRNTGILGAIVVGVGSALVASPCSSPILAGVLAMMATTSTLASGSLLMALYGVGFSFVFILIGLGLAKLSSLPKNGRWMNRVHQLGSSLLVVAGIYFLTKDYSAKPWAFFSILNPP